MMRSITFPTRTITCISGSAGFLLLILFICTSSFSSCAALIAAARSNGGANAKPILRGVRVFGGNSETSPPIITRAPQSVFGSQGSQQETAANDAAGVIGSSFVTVEVDVQCFSQPTFIAMLVHCDASWKEDKNFAINDPSLRITQIQVFQANTFSNYFTHRARFTVPSAEIQLRFSGNWKAKIFDVDDLTTPIAEARFFVVDQETVTSLTILTDAYSPRIGGTSPAANLLEATITAPPQFFDENFHTVTLYRTWRWNEPINIVQSADQSRLEQLYGRSSKISILGFSTGQKRFRITAVPAENEYRVLDIRDAMRFPATAAPLRFALADLRRNGIIFMRADDGAFTSEGVSTSRDEYVPIEFVLASEGAPSSRDIFVVGSFNNWQVLPDWKMKYDSTLHQYTLAQWIRRGRHNYLYASGISNKKTSGIETFDYEECEGNSLSANHTFYALFYYRNPQFGGYDALLGVAAANTSRRNR